jgi:hypothetical protein
MYPSTKAYLKREILKLIEKTNDTEHKGGRVTAEDIKEIVEELQGV